MKLISPSLSLRLLKSAGFLLLFVGVWITANSIRPAKAANELKIAFGELPETELTNFDSNSGQEKDPKGLKSAAKDVVAKLVAEDYEGIRRNFNEEMKRGLSAEKMREVWNSVLQNVGGYRSQSEPSVSQVQGYDVLVIKCQMERGAITVEVDFDPSGKIGGLWVRPAS